MAQRLCITFVCTEPSSGLAEVHEFGEKAWVWLVQSLSLAEPRSFCPRLVAISSPFHQTDEPTDLLATPLEMLLVLIPPHPQPSKGGIPEVMSKPNDCQSQASPREVVTPTRIIWDSLI